MKALNRDIDLCERRGVPLKLEFGVVGVSLPAPVIGAARTPIQPPQK
jgi:hypothetical protein